MTVESIEDYYINEAKKLGGRMVKQEINAGYMLYQKNPKGTHVRYGREKSRGSNSTS
ncbi:MAG TPA: hypothetical protein VNI77_05130 [Nitrososphaera sp.]|nr:hypothetical protein [Nitrososphaera sp.]